MLLDSLLYIHSLFRWAVVFTSLAIAFRCARGVARQKAWRNADTTFAQLWVGAVDIQLSLGLMLYFSASPSAAIARQNYRAAWAIAPLRFFGIVHPLSMIAAAVVMHATWIWTRRADDDDPERFRRLGIGVLGAVLLVLAAIPWPFLSYGRPLARL